MTTTLTTVTLARGDFKHKEGGIMMAFNQLKIKGHGWFESLSIETNGHTELLIDRLNNYNCRYSKRIHAVDVFDPYFCHFKFNSNKTSGASWIEIIDSEVFFHIDSETLHDLHEDSVFLILIKKRFAKWS